MKNINELFTNTETFDELNTEELSLLFLIPLIQTAWVCKAVSPHEKYLIYTAAREESIDERHDFNDVIDDLLKHQPSQEFFEKCLSLINDSLVEMTVKDRTSTKSKIIKRCEQVAASAGGKSLMDVDHHISQAEKDLLNKLHEVLY